MACNGIALPFAFYYSRCVGKLLRLLLASYDVESLNTVDLCLILIRRDSVGWGTVLQAVKFAGSILTGVTIAFHWHNTSGRTMPLGLNQPQTEMSKR
jgi:hypothetical protein